MKSLSADEAHQLLENARWKVVECARRTDLSLAPKTGHIDHVGRDERGELIVGMTLNSLSRTMTFASESWATWQLNQTAILLYRTRPDDQIYDIPSRDADYYLLTRVT